jgi:hypothetical protein
MGVRAVILSKITHGLSMAEEMKVNGRAAEPRKIGDGSLEMGKMSEARNRKLIFRE